MRCHEHAKVMPHYPCGESQDWLDRIERGVDMTCRAPGCDDEAPVVFIADAHGRIGGQDAAPGDELRYCWPHAADIYMTQGIDGPEEVAEWLRPDAADPPNTWSRAPAGRIVWNV